MPRPPTPDVLDRLKAAVGPAGFTDDPSDMAPYLREWRNRYPGNTPLVLRPGSVQEVSDSGPHLPRRRRRRRAPGREHRAGGRTDPAPRRRRRAAVARPPAPRPRRRPGRQHHHRGSRLHASGRAAGGVRGRPVVPAQPGGRGQLPDRRQPVDQRGRHPRGPLRQQPGSGAGAGGGHRRRHVVGRAARPAQGQHRLRSEAPVPRRRGHAGGDHRRGAEAVPPPPPRRDRVRRRARCAPRRWRCWPACAAPPTTPCWRSS